ncbi:unnamed protein product [Mytilus coruscus]|uniref:Uncharacterized protein n=1 Tax=Mytilus coruscus TaxID=42192 RepID=A0A6J8AVN9_MYTCO|nr:unnamed protein product [Mytilus coruscus]
MYLRIKITSDDRPFHRLLWRSMKTEQVPEEYEFNSVVFGVNSSPFQAQLVSRKHAEMMKDSYPRAAETVLKSTYMDDNMDSVLNDQQEEDCASQVDLDEGYLPSVKTLGVIWQADNDIFTFKANPPADDFKFTKRNILSTVATLFDPLGFIAPHTVKGKLLLQEMWTAGLDWDDPLDEILVDKSREWFRELDELCCIKLPRFLQLDDDIVSTSLHTFSDASQEAYGAVVYARHEFKSGTISTRLIAAKSKVAPLTSVSIPQLELMAAVLGLRLALSITHALEMPEDKMTFWSDRREEIREYEHECYTCRKRKAKVAEQVMAPLPEIRFKTL